MEKINKLAIVLGVILIAGCANPQVKTQPPITATTNKDLDNLGSTLSQADGKAVILREWLKGQN
jgi:outer membrane murein-binding lipoprotein Lpp